MAKDYSHLQGWVDDKSSVEQVMNDLPFPVFSSLYPPMQDTGKGKTVLLYDVLKKVVGKFPVRLQGTGDCVSMSGGYCADIATSVDIFLKKENEIWIAEHTTEILYWGSRVVIGKGRLGNQPGSVGAWLAKFMNEYGTLPRQKYGNIDLTQYSSKRADQWGSPNFKLSQDVLDEVKKHPIQTVSKVSTYEELRDLICNGYPVSICSNFGFNNKRDKDGFLYPKGNWAHAMTATAVEDNGRPKVNIQNSWGANWVSGPKYLDQPEGSFWVDAATIEKMLKQGDSWAMSGYVGFPTRKLNTRII